MGKAQWAYQLCGVWGLLWKGSVTRGDSTAGGWNHLECLYSHVCQLMLAISWDLSGALSQNNYTGFSVLSLPGLAWASLQHGSWVLRASFPGGPGGSCTTFYDLTLEISLASLLQ